jgi:regulator of replication initiation timing
MIADLVADLTGVKSQVRMLIEQNADLKVRVENIEKNQRDDAR